jgi:hypothetical protein
MNLQFSRKILVFQGLLQRNFKKESAIGDIGSGHLLQVERLFEFEIKSIFEIVELEMYESGRLRNSSSQGLEFFLTLLQQGKYRTFLGC